MSYWTPDLDALDENPRWYLLTPRVCATKRWPIMVALRRRCQTKEDEILFMENCGAVIVDPKTSRP